MGIFTRVRDIIASNISAMLDKAEDPEKLVKLMIREMEDTLVEVKASCAGVMASRKRAERELAEVQGRADEWAARAQLAVEKDRDDLGREALGEKRRYTDRAKVVEDELAQCGVMVEQYQNDIMQLEEKLAAVREKQRLLTQRHVRAQQKKRTQTNLRKADTAAAVAKFEGLEYRIDRLEAEGDLVNLGRKPNVEEQFAQLEGDEDIEAELEALRTAAKKTGKSSENDA